MQYTFKYQDEFTVSRDVVVQWCGFTTEEWMELSEVEREEYCQNYAENKLLHNLVPIVN